MSTEVITAVLGSAALAFAVGRRVRANRRESRRERGLAQHASFLDNQDVDITRVPATLTPFQEGYLAGLGSRQDILSERAREQRAPVH
jgi:hypothetical protein